MKKTLTIVTIVAVLSGIGMISFSKTKRPVDMNKAEKIQKNIKEAKEKAKEEAKKKAEEEAKKETAEESSQVENSN